MSELIETARSTLRLDSLGHQQLLGLMEFHAQKSTEEASRVIARACAIVLEERSSPK